MSLDRTGPTTRYSVVAYRQKKFSQQFDTIAAEEPLEIRVVQNHNGDWVTSPVNVLMRTPGHDFELTAGYLFGEGFIRNPGDIWRVEYSPQERPPKKFNQVNLWLRPGVTFDVRACCRSYYASSSTGVGGQASVEWVIGLCSKKIGVDFEVSPRLFFAIQRRFGGVSSLARVTGGIQVAALFDSRGRLIQFREDVHRNHALDKLIGFYILGKQIPLNRHLLVCSGCLSVEQIQRAALAGIAVVVSVGAPSNLAIELAQHCGIMLIGFLRRGRFKIYSGREPLVASSHKGTDTAG